MKATRTLTAVSLVLVTLRLPACGRTTPARGAQAGTRGTAGRSVEGATPALAAGVPGAPIATGPGDGARTGVRAPGAHGWTGAPELGAGLDSAGGLRRLEPLQESEIRLYQEVMAAASLRLAHPTPEDRRVLARAEAAQRARAGTDPAAGVSDAEVIERALGLRTRMDDEIVRERHIDVHWYELVRDRIESVIPAHVAQDRGAGEVAPPAPISGSAAEYLRLAEQRERADAAALAPHRAELQRLIRRVRQSAVRAPR